MTDDVSKKSMPRCAASSSLAPQKIQTPKKQYARFVRLAYELFTTSDFRERIK